MAIVDGFTTRRAEDIKDKPEITPAGLSKGMPSLVNAVSAEALAQAAPYKKIYDAIHYGFHEILHNLGLNHFWNSQPGDKGPNAMNYGNGENNITPEQIATVWTTVLGGVSYYFKMPAKDFGGQFSTKPFSPQDAIKQLKDFLSDPKSGINYDQSKVNQ